MSHKISLQIHVFTPLIGYLDDLFSSATEVNVHKSLAKLRTHIYIFTTKFTKISLTLHVHISKYYEISTQIAIIEILFKPTAATNKILCHILYDARFS